jgi:sugar lactone lactonase YvrE
MYFTDSMVRTIWTYEFDPATGALGERRVFATLAANDGVPDGLTVDSEGFVWSAVWDGWRVLRYAPDGTIERTIRMPVQRPSSCMFGGPDLKTLYITSACVELGWDALKNGPLAGSLFALSTDVAGLPEAPFGG